MKLKRNSLRTRLLAVYVGMVVLGFGGLTLWSANQIAQATYDDFGNGLQLNAFVLSTQLIEVFEYDLNDGRQLAQDAAADLDAEIALLDRQGDWFYSTDAYALGIEPLDEYRMTDGWVVATAPVNEDGDELLGYVQVRAPLATPRAIVFQRWVALGGMFVLFSVVGVMATLWLVNTLTRPLSELRDTTLSMAKGDLSQRMVLLPEDEIGDVGRAFNEMAERVEALVNEQRAFASNASHELRTPLTTIRLRTEALLDGNLDDVEAQEYIAEIDGEVARLGKLVEDLLLLSRLDAKRTEAGQERFEVNRLVESLQREYAGKAAEKRIDFQVQLPEKGLPVAANVNHMRIVFGNVLNNAFKYTPEGGMVNVVLSNGGDMAQLEVRDSGRGIAPEELPHIGQRFYRTDKARSRQNTPGIGLGLALAGSILELYDGRFSVNSIGLEQGTTVTVCWPLEGEGMRDEGCVNGRLPMVN